MAVSPIRGGFWLQHAGREADQLVAFADELAQTPAGRPGLSLGPVNVPNTLNRLFERARNAGVAIVDPHGHLLDDPEPTRRAQEHFPWLVPAPRPSTQADWEQWMQAALNHQLSADLRGSASAPSFVMTASPFMTASNGNRELYAVLDAAVTVASRQSPGSCWLCVSVDRTYVREEPHLTRLLNAMLATGGTNFVFRASQSQLPPVEDLRYLQGLREVVQMCEANGLRVYLPNSGWLGWLAMAWGAWGFSGGMAAGTWNDRVKTPMSRPEQPSLPYFEAQLMRSLRWRVHEALVHEPTYQACTCPDCVQMGANHDLMLAKRHQIRNAHNEGAALANMALPQRRASVANRLDAAIAFRDGLSRQTRLRVEAEFLDRWRALV